MQFFFFIEAELVLVIKKRRDYKMLRKSIDENKNAYFHNFKKAFIIHDPRISKQDFVG